MLKRIFKLCFGREDAEFERSLSLDIASWQILCSPQTQSDGTLTLFHYENKMVKNAILAIKRRNNRQMIEIMAGIASDFLVEELSERAMMEDFSNPMIVGIPISRKNMIQKGFNHGEEIAKAIAKNILEIEFVERMLVKTRHTEPQKNLPRSQRLSNLSHSIEVAKKYVGKIKGRCIIIVDDVTTTGATLKEARRACLKAGARKILCLAVAH